MRKFRKGLFFLTLCMTLLVVLYMTIHAGHSKDEQEILAKIRAAIQNRGAQWEAGETSMSILPAEERRKRLGALVPQNEGDEAAG